MTIKNDSLALFGGTPIRQEPMPKYNTIGAEEKAAVMAVLDSGELSGFIAYDGKEFWGGRAVLEFEQAFCRRYGLKYAVAVNSATSGLHCAVSATGVGPGDEVIVTPYTMSASATAVLMCGAVPIFADIDDRTFCLDPKSVEANITPYTKAIMAVNLYGHPAPLLELRAIADEHKLWLIEDNAQAPSALCGGRYTATIGDIGVFSFNRHKTMQSGEGGVVVTNNEKLALKAALMRNHGEVVVEAMQLDDIVNTVGVNYRMTEVEAAIALVQFGKLDELNKRRVELADRLTAGLKRIPGLTPPFVVEGCTHVYYFYPIKYDETVTGIPRALFAKAVQAEGFTLRAGYVTPLYLQPLYQKKICFGDKGYPFTASPRNAEISYAKGLCPVTERLQDSELLVTNITYPPLTESDMDAFVEACEKVLRNRDSLLAKAA